MNLSRLVENLREALWKREDPSRRRFLRQAALALPALTSIGSLLAASRSFAQDHTGMQDISYLWHPKLEAIQDYAEEVADVLGLDVRKKLRIVQGTENFGLVYDRNGEVDSTYKVAARHTQLLLAADLDEAVPIRDDGYDELFNVSYGLGPNLEAITSLYGRVYSQLGSKVGRNLFIEETDQENFVLVYKRLGDRDSTLDVARKHTAILRSQGIEASITREELREVVYGESAFLHEKEPQDLPHPILIPRPAPSQPHSVPTPRPTRPHSKPLPTPPVHRPAPPRRGAPESPAHRIASSGLEDSVEQYVSRLRSRGGLKDNEATSWLVYDLTTGQDLVTINADRSRQCASMFKPFVALAYFHQVKKGKERYDAKTKRLMERMINNSSNSATNQLMRRLGGARHVDEILSQNYGHLLPDTEIVESIPPGGRAYRNTASPNDYRRFLEAMWKDQLPYAPEIKRIMSLPGGTRERIRGSQVPSGTIVYHKTGTTGLAVGDMGILSFKGKNGRRYPVIVVGVAQRDHKNDSTGIWGSRVTRSIGGVSDLVYQEMKGRYDLI
ncbi:MAG TPA: serine hydrolase [Candidatus Nanoarchaeia archaeon]|nr:serine hydrolase [Candidatus Nanoarchaeia archaeon]